MITAMVEWGPVSAWAGAIATILVVITTALVALGFSLISAVRISTSRSRKLNLGAVTGRPRRKARHCGFVSESGTAGAARPAAALGA